MRLNILFAASTLLIAVFSITVADSANAEQLLSEKSNASGEVRSKIHLLSEVQAQKTSATYLLRTPRNQNFVPQLNGSRYNGGNPTPVRSSRETRPRGWLRNALPRQVTSNVVSVTNVKVNTTDKGIELILITANSVKLQVSPKKEGNSYIADIPNAQLQLASGDFRQEKPFSGIALVTVANVDASTLRVTVVGETSTPVIKLFDSQTEGLVFGVTPAASTVQQPITPEQKPPTEEKQPPIELEVTAPPDTYRVPNTSIGTKTDTPLRDIPQSIQVIPRQVIEDQGAQNLSDVLQNVGVLQYGPSSRIVDNFTIRGFNTRNTYRNGLLDRLGTFGNLKISTTNTERIEVLRGPASVLYGQVTPGGIINVVTKQPLSQPYYATDFTAGSYQFYQPAFDFSGSLTKDASLLYRLNASYRTSEDFTDFYNEERYFIAPVISWRIGENTKLTFDSEYLNLKQSTSDTTQPPGATVLPNPNGKIPRSRYLGELNDGYNQEFGRLSYNLEHRFSENWSISNSFQYAFINLTGSASLISSSLNPDNRTVSRIKNIYLDPVSDNNYTTDTHVVGKFKTGSIAHQLLFGFDLLREINPKFDTIQRDAGLIDVFNPVYGQPLGSILRRFDFKTKNDALGIYIQDQVSIANNLKLLLGGRYDFVDSEFTNFLNSTTTSQSDSAFSPRVGIVYQPIEPVSLYASYSRSFEQVIGTAFDNSLFKPRRGTQYEVGVKTDLFDKKLSATLALYELTLTNVLTADPINPGFSVQTGEQRSRGVELSVAGEILPGWNVIGFYGYTNGEVTSDNRIPVGNQLPTAPEHIASLWTTYTISKGDLKGFGGGIGLDYVSETVADLANSFRLPSYFITNAALYYQKNNFNVGVNFKNLFDTVYYQPFGNDTRVVPGRPFTAELTVKWEF
ncbi:MAG: TonB-dependent siderophore receptor [Nostoc sp.]|uniref:TonB-dependent siderophore receptor n=1 Tax=Nostoc sp. TaxID=1180 RepID=UPI002FF05ED7